MHNAVMAVAVAVVAVAAVAVEMDSAAQLYRIPFQFMQNLVRAGSSTYVLAASHILKNAHSKRDLIHKCGGVYWINLPHVPVSDRVLEASKQRNTT